MTKNVLSYIDRLISAGLRVTLLPDQVGGCCEGNSTASLQHGCMSLADTEQLLQHTAGGTNSSSRKGNVGLTRQKAIV